MYVGVGVYVLDPSPTRYKLKITPYVGSCVPAQAIILREAELQNLTSFLDAAGYRTANNYPAGNVMERSLVKY